MLEVYPSITESEFASACSSFHKKCYDRLHGTPWLSVVWTGYELRIRQTRKPPIESRSSSEPSLAVNGSPGPLQASDTDDKRFAELEADDDDEALEIPLMPSNSTVYFSITHSPTYSVPVLWFTSPAISTLEHIHHNLVPEHLSESVRSIGVLGGISVGYHPVTDVPSFFVHPCNTHQALHAVHTGEGVAPHEYLILWLGVIGAAVGLHVPSSIVSEIPSEGDPVKSWAVYS